MRHEIQDQVSLEIGRRIAASLVNFRALRMNCLLPSKQIFSGD